MPGMLIWFLIIFGTLFLLACLVHWLIRFWQSRQCGATRLPSFHLPWRSRCECLGHDMVQDEFINKEFGECLWYCKVCGYSEEPKQRVEPVLKQPAESSPGRAHGRAHGRLSA